MEIDIPAPPHWIPPSVLTPINELMTEYVKQRVEEREQRVSAALEEARWAKETLPDIKRTPDQLLNCQACEEKCVCIEAQVAKRDEIVSRSMQIVDNLLAEAAMLSQIGNNFEALLALESAIAPLVRHIVDALPTTDEFFVSVFVPACKNRLLSASYLWAQNAIFIPLDVIESIRTLFQDWISSLKTVGHESLLDQAILAHVIHWDHPLLDHLLDERFYTTDIGAFPQEPLSTALARLQILDRVDQDAFISYSRWVASTFIIGDKDAELIVKLSKLMRPTVPLCAAVLLCRFFEKDTYDRVTKGSGVFHDVTIDALLEFVGDQANIVFSPATVVPRLGALSALSLVTAASDIFDPLNLFHLLSYPAELGPQLATEFIFARLDRIKSEFILPTITNCLESARIIPPRRMLCVAVAMYRILDKSISFEMTKKFLKCIATALPPCISRSSDPLMFDVVRILNRILIRAFHRLPWPHSPVHHVAKLFSKQENSILKAFQDRLTLNVAVASPGARSPALSPRVVRAAVTHKEVNDEAFAFAQCSVRFRRHGSDADIIFGWKDLAHRICQDLAESSTNNIQYHTYERLLSFSWQKASWPIVSQLVQKCAVLLSKSSTKTKNELELLQLIQGLQKRFGASDASGAVVSPLREANFNTVAK
jgi:hypothetical protein